MTISRPEPVGVHDLPSEYFKGLDTITNLALAKDLDSLSDLLNISRGILEISLDSVGDGKRKGEIFVSGERQKVTHFAHMVRVAYMIQTFFPEDSYGRILGILHDAKEEAIPGKLVRYKDADTVTGKPISLDIDLLTEEEPSPEEVTSLSLPEGVSAEYIAKYRKYIKKLHANWPRIGSLELCDRLDGANFDYLKDPKYADRLRQKVLESVGRVYATISIADNPVAERIKQSCRGQLPEFGVQEAKVIAFSSHYL